MRVSSVNVLIFNSSLIFSLGFAGGVRAADVDVAIVFANDVSSSMKGDSARFQRDGHVLALRSAEVSVAIKSGMTGCISVAYIEWSSVGSMVIILPWTLICNKQDAEQAAARIEDFGKGSGRDIAGGRTSVSYAIDASSIMLDRCPDTAMRKVIDISSNGMNNDGPPVSLSRHRALAKGYVINAITLAEIEPAIATELPAYFHAHVIGGPGAFVMPASTLQGYQYALRRKFVIEIGSQDGARLPLGPT